MNIFYLDNCPRQIAKWLVNSHIVKMPLESAQMLSTAHRLLDGKKQTVQFVNEKGKSKKKVLYLLDGEIVELAELNGKIRPVNIHPDGVICYSVAHASHPSTVWTCASDIHYAWHAHFLRAMLDEYTFRYNRKHAVEKIYPFLSRLPRNIPQLEVWSEPTPAMPDIYKVDGDSITSYRNYYAGEKWRFAKWKKRTVPEWFKSQMSSVWTDDRRDERRAFINFTSKKKTLRMHEDVFTHAVLLCKNT